MVVIDQIVRSKRKSIGFQVNNKAQLIVRAPRWVSDKQIEEAVHRKSDWILEKQEFFRTRAPKQKVFVDGEELVNNLFKAVVFDGEAFLMSDMVLKNARDHMLIWYQNQAAIYLKERLEYQAKLAGLTYKWLKINCALTRWGSCSYQGTINLTWRLIMAPPRGIDYVIVHELMHIKQHNHSAKFWEEVRRAIPDYKNDERWLKQNGHLMSIWGDGWRAVYGKAG